MNCHWQRIELRIASEEEGELIPEESLPWEKGERKLKSVAWMVERTDFSQTCLVPALSLFVLLGKLLQLLEPCFLMGEMK